MGGEVQDDAGIDDPVRERPLPAGDHLVEAAELARGQPAPHLLQCGVEPLDVPDAAQGVGAGEGLDDVLRRLRVVRERLLDERGDACLGQLQPDGFVRDGGRGQHAHLDVAVEELIEGADHVEARCPLLCVDRRDQLDAGQFTQDAGVVTAHAPKTDEPGADRAAHRVIAMVTAATTWSSWACDKAGWTGSDSTSAAARSVTGRSSSSA